MIVRPVQKLDGSRTGTLFNITAERISEVLGFEPNCSDIDDDYKVENSWGAIVDETHRINIWDYRGSQMFGQFSTWGPAEVYETLFPDNWRAGL
jgi:hypothetical protein